MPGVGIDDFGASLIKYLPGTRRTLHRKSRLREIPRGKIQWEGSQVRQHLHVGYNTSLSDLADGGTLPPADRQAYVTTDGNRRFTAGSVQVTDGILANAKTTQNAAVRVVDSELRNMLEAFRMREGLMLPRDGTGIVTQLGATVSGATFTVDDARGLWPRGRYEIRDNPTTTTIHNNFTVTSVARARTAASESTVTPNATLAASGQATDDYVYWGQGDWSSYGRAVTGLDRMIDDSTAAFQGVTVTTYPWWTSPVFDGGGATQDLTSTLFRQVLATLKQEDVDYTTPGGLLVYTSVWDGVTVEELYENTLRITPDTKAVGLKGGMTFQSSLGTITILTDPYVQYGYMFFINRSAISHLVQKELDWRPGGTAGIFDRSDSFLGYTATALEIHDLMIMERNTCAKITNLRVSPQSAY